MTIKEIIKNLLDQAEDREASADPEDPEDIFALDARALREAARLLGGTEPPDGPLTLEQLRGMDGEPVWVVGLSSINDFKGHWDILVMEGENNELAVFPRCLEYGWFKDYGITWTAYRRRTMGDLKGADSNEQNCG